MNFAITHNRTLDWKNMSHFSNQACSSLKNWDVFKKNVKKWDQCFNIGYFDYRAELKRISLESFKATGIPIVDRNELSDDSIVLPTDDDDWFHPDIKQYLDEFFKSGLQVVRWNGWLYDCNRKETFINSDTWRGTQHTTPSSNEHAFLKTCSPPRGHTNRPRKCFKIDQALSIWVRHPASFCDLQRDINILKRFKKLKESSIPLELEWARNYIESLRDIRLHLNIKML
jgi:hypothetical protein